MALDRLQLGTAPDSWGVGFAVGLVFHPHADTHVDPLPIAARTAGHFAGCGLGPVRRWPY
jgi:hypothetical protein